MSDQRTVRRFADLRARPEKPEADPGREPIEIAMRRCFTTADGERALDWLVSEASRLTPENCPESVLREAEGARRLVARLRAVLAS